MIGTGSCWRLQGLTRNWQTDTPVPTEGYPTLAGPRQSLDLKYAGRRTPYGTSVAWLVRLAPDILVAPCGNCGVPLKWCKCSFRVDGVVGP